VRCGFEFEIAFALECAQVLIDALPVAQSHRARQIGARRRPALLRDELGDPCEDLPLTGLRGVEGSDTIHLYGILFQRRISRCRVP